MTAKQWRKLELRMRHLLNENKLVHLTLWEEPDGTVNVQVVTGKTEVIKD